MTCAGSSKPLGELIQGIDAVPYGSLADPISGICYDSRKVKGGELFAALAGEKTNGHDYIAKAIKAGASAILTDVPVVESAGEHVAQILATHPRQALAQIAERFYGSPSVQMKLIGVTGTNGKTTTAYLIRHLLGELGQKTGMLGTVEYDLIDRKIIAPLTTPESVDFSMYLGQMCDAGATAAVVEVSSHALSQYRVYGHRFSEAIFTNLTRDHLDYYGDMEAYAAAKKKLFNSLDPAAAAIINAADSFSEYMVRDCKCPVLRYGRGGQVQAKVIHQDVMGTELILQYGELEVPVTSPLVGSYNLENVLAAMSAVLQLGYPLEKIAKALANFAGVPGRLQRFEQNGITAFVDYAHTDDALRSVLNVLRPLTRGKLHVVFGCGGDRDRGKRPLMARAAEELADSVVITSDNPRTEDPERILHDIASGLHDPAAAKTIPDRHEAVQTVITEACPGDVVLVAGKGHEDYQILGTEKIHLDDRELVREALASLKKGHGRQQCA